MEPIKTIAPVFIGWTRSFWLGIVPAGLTLFDVLMAAFTQPGNEPVAAFLSSVLGQITGWTPDQIHDAMKAAAPIYALIVAQQRAGLTRPYTLDPAKEKAVVQAVEDGKSAFELGKQVGEALKRSR